MEVEVTRLLRERFSFRCVPLEGQAHRMSSAGLEGALIGTVACCERCQPSKQWLGLHSPDKRVRRSGLWQVQHLAAEPMSGERRQRFLAAVAESK